MNPLIGFLYFLGSGCNCGLTKLDTASMGDGELAWYLDEDGDGYGSGTVYYGDEAPEGYVDNANDCDDENAFVHPEADEVCNGQDDDCDGEADEDAVDGQVYFRDDDVDGFGDPNNEVRSCVEDVGFVDNGWDCDDSVPTEPVVADANAGAPYGVGTLMDPLDTLQAAIDAAELCVVAFGGTYTETIDLSGRSLDVWGVEGASQTILDPRLATCSGANPGACQSVVRMAGNANATSRLHGFTIVNGTGSGSSTSYTDACADSNASYGGQNTCTITLFSFCGGGVYVEGDDPVLEDLVLTGNRLPDYGIEVTGDFQQTVLYSFGGGLCVRGGVVDVIGTDLVENYADQGGGLYAVSGALVTFDQGMIKGNTATDGAGIGIEGANLAATNAVIGCNEATTDGGGVFVGASSLAIFENVVLYLNESSESGQERGTQVYATGGTSLSLANSIVQSSGDAFALYGSGVLADLAYNDVYNASGPTLGYGGGLSAGVGSLEEDPRLTDPHCDGTEDKADFTLRTTSPCVDAGDPDPSFNDADGSRNDMGAWGGSGGVW